MSATHPVEAPLNSHSIATVTDICGYKYNVVKIGAQLWMGENMRCGKYDTGSEQAGQTIPVSTTASYAPYYNNCFTDGVSVTYSSNSGLTDKQKSYIGNFYNWAAALGLTSAQSLAQTTEFATSRQGICPNGWHVPSDAEWLQMVDYIEVTDGKGEDTAAKHLKTTTGWSSNNGNGVDTYGFSMLPADRGVGDKIYGIGGFAKFTTASAKSPTFADYMNVMGNALKIVGSVGYTSAKSHTYTVRCVKAVEPYEIKFVNYDGTVLQSSSVYYGDTPAYNGETPTHPATAQYIYTFKGWDKEITAVTESRTYTATYTTALKKYHVKFLNYNRTVLQESDLEYGSTPEYSGEAPVKPTGAHFSYTFTGWDPTIEPVTGNKSYTAQYSAELRVNDAPENSHSINEVTDICGNKYNAVKIGHQLWLSENMRCNKYDTESERVGAEIPLGDRSTVGSNPYYQVYPSAGSNETGHAQSLSGSQIYYLGLFYSWSAAVGFATGEEAEAQTTAFDMARQGICPNGWHIPTPEEWRELVDYIEVTDGNGIGTAGKHLKSASGWFNDGNGLDTYGFSALPADRAGIFATYGVGGWAKYWSATATGANYVSTCQLKYSSNAFLYNSDEANRKYYDALCVRCVKAVEQYEIKFVNYDGTELQSSSVYYGDTPVYNGETPTQPATAQYTYTFSGWDKEIVSVTEATDYTATYTSTTNKYLIKFVNYDGTELQSGEVEYGTVPTYGGETPTKPATAAETYTFIGWDSEPTVVTEAKTYTAQFSSTTNQYTVRFLNYDGDVLQTESLDYGTTPTYTGETPTRDATAQYTYTFSGWSPEVVAVTEAADYTAQYTSTTNKYEIKFVNYDGTELQSSEVEYGTVPTYTGETPTKPATAAETCTFIGWDSEPTAVTEAKTYTAQFSSTTNQYTVRFLNYDGDVLQTESLDYGTTPTYTGETPTKDATAQYTYTFSGWDKEIVSVTEATDYTATYTSTTNKYLIKFVNYDGTELQSSEVEYGTVPTYGGETPVKPATAQDTYTFTGWDSEPTAVTEAKTYTAQFSSITNQYIVTVNAESHGTVTGGGTYPYGTEVTLTAKPEDGYDIDHWSNGSASAEIKITVTEDVTLTAYFKMTKKPNPDNTPACNNIPSVAKYEWLLMVNVKALNEQGYTFGESDVTWYKVVGEMDNLDKPEERTDEAVGTGYYYTIDETLNGTGSYYALVDLPLKTSDVACPGTLRTQLYSYEAPTLKSAMVMEPTIVAPMQPIEVKNLPESADTEIFVFDTVGKLYRSFKTQGNATATFNAEMRPGVYVVLVRTGKNKTSLKYIVRRSVAQ